MRAYTCSTCKNKQYFKEKYQLINFKSDQELFQVTDLIPLSAINTWGVHVFRKGSLLQMNFDLKKYIYFDAN